MAATTDTTVSIKFPRFRTSQNCRLFFLLLILGIHTESESKTGHQKQTTLYISINSWKKHFQCTQMQVWKHKDCPGEWGCFLKIDLLICWYVYLFIFSHNLVKVFSGPWCFLGPAFRVWYLGMSSEPAQLGAWPMRKFVPKEKPGVLAYDWLHWLPNIPKVVILKHQPSGLFSFNLLQH